MAKYFSGITLNRGKYTVSILDDNLNIIFLDKLDLNNLVDLFRRKNVSVVSIDYPTILYKNLWSQNQVLANNEDCISINKRDVDNLLLTKNIFFYSDRFKVNKDTINLIANLSDHIDKLGFSYRKNGKFDKLLIESYPELSFSLLGYNKKSNVLENDILMEKLELLKNRGIRIKDYLKREQTNLPYSINSLCQAYISYLYFKGDTTSLGNIDEGIIAMPIPIKNTRFKPRIVKEPKATSIKEWESKKQLTENKVQSDIDTVKLKNNSKTISEYCGAQYLYTNVDGIIRTKDLRPIKTYRPFTEIYELKRIRLVQVVVGTTDGSKKVKAKLIPCLDHSNSFKAANAEDKQKLDNFWNNQGDKRGCLIKFNMVEVVK